MRDEEILSASFDEKVGEHLATFVGEKAGGYFNFVVKLGVVHSREDRAAGSGFGVRGGVDEAGDAGVEDGSGTHGAGFEGGVERAIFEAIVGQVTACVAEGDYFGVGGGVAVAEDSVLAAAYDDALVGDDCSYRDFASGFGGLGFGDGSAEMGEGVIHLFYFSAGRLYGCYSRGVCRRSIGFRFQRERITTDCRLSRDRQ